jgi:hypothetical protein
MALLIVGAIAVIVGAIAVRSRRTRVARPDTAEVMRSAGGGAGDVQQPETPEGPSNVDGMAEHDCAQPEPGPCSGMSGWGDPHSSP